ncbi:MAG: hypothetical protein N4A35_15770 [Flavobacteriales bacterium]|jgi:hypothetical protein|nr:hypothetical protein [Flavobacteriales bacterium]
MKRKVIPLLLAMGMLSCNQQRQTPAELERETPEAIEDQSDFGFSSSYKRDYENIVERLYNEAVEKNVEVGAIQESIDEVHQYYVDSLADYNKYIRINEEYWNTANRYIAEISDTTLRNSIKELFQEAEVTYCSSKEDLLYLNDQIALEKERLENQVQLLKLVVTLPMIQNYQVNEKPDTLQLKTILDRLKAIENRVEVYTQTKSE